MGHQARRGRILPLRFMSQMDKFLSRSFHPYDSSDQDIDIDVDYCEVG